METINTMIVVPLKELVLTVVSFIPTLIGVLVILTLGLLLGKLLHDVLARVLKEIHIDKLADKIGLSKALHKGGIKHSFSHLVSGFVYLIVVIKFFLMALSYVGLTAVGGLMTTVIDYVPRVVTGVFVLGLGMILAKIVSVVVHTVASNLDMPNPKLAERVVRWMILLYVIKLTLVEFGYGGLFVGPVFHIWFGGLVLGLALAFGLGGRDIAHAYLHRRFDKKK